MADDSNPFNSVLDMPSLDDAVKETVVRNTKMQRSQTTDPTSPQKSSNVTRRSLSQDSNNVQEKSKSKSKPNKKGSQHADVIDRLDFTGIGPLVHHDGPFDACAPSRNRHKNKAPMMAWSPIPTDEQMPYNDNPYPSAAALRGMSDHPSYDPPKKKVDAIAEAWGIHEPEPFEEFFAGGGNRGDTPASSIYNGKESHSPATRTRRTRERERVAGERRSVLPPPQPIFISDSFTSEEPAATAPPTAPGFKRTKSLMHRIRKMRDAPNVPVAPADYDDVPSPHPDQENQPSRPTHRSQNSFLGRFGNSTTPKTPAATEPEPFVYIEATTNKDLPATPPARSAKAGEGRSNGYFDEKSGSPPSAGTPGVGRKASIMKKMGRVVKGR